MKRIVLPFILVIGTFGACSSSESQRGEPSVYQQINAETDCSALQETFDRASANNDRAEPGSPAHGWTTDYMKAADKRMEAVGCYNK